MDEFIQFRFVPTMRCNLRCSYCFLEHSNGCEPTMFDRFTPSQWATAMKNFSAYEVEFYIWGGEPFCIDGTYELVRELAHHDFVTWARIDTNTTFANKILNRCPSEKVLLNCSWHPHSLGFDRLWELVLRLRQRGMVGMVNLVASDQNLAYLRKHGLQLGDLVKRFQDHELFLNVAADFGKGDDPAHRRLVENYTCPEDWLHIHDKYPCHGVTCGAAQSYFSVDGQTGDLSSCGYRRPGLLRWSAASTVGNFFTGELQRRGHRPCPQRSCPSIVSYAHRSVNAMRPRRHLEDYVRRNRQYRLERGTT
jgi:hypothetical protein